MSRVVLICRISVLLVPASGLLAGAWTLEQGRLRVKSAFFIHQSGERYASATLFCGTRACRNGERVPYFFNGSVDSRAVYLDARYGLTDFIELGLEIPYFDIAFRDDINPDRGKTASIGDVRFGGRVRLIQAPLVATLGLEAKAPVGFFNKDSEIVPTGDGQWDIEIRGQLGRSLWPWPAYINLDIGYKFRLKPDIETTNLDPGNEFTFRGEAGLEISKGVLLKAALDGLYGSEFTAFFNNSRQVLSDSERSILYFEPAIYWSPGTALAVEAVVKVSLSGKNYPAGNIYGLGVSYTLGLF